MTVHTMKPTSEQYKTVCKRLIFNPKLEDIGGKGEYVSKMKILRWRLPTKPTQIIKIHNPAIFIDKVID